MNKQRLTEIEIKKRLMNIHGSNVVIDMSTYVNARTKARFIDKNYGEWWAQPGGVFRGAGHKNRFLNRQRLSYDALNTRIMKIHSGSVQCVSSSYVHTYKKAKFIDFEFGEWEAYPHNVLNGSTHPDRGLKNRKITWMKKYGVDNPFKSDIVQKKVLRNIRKNVTRIYHWKTGKELVCVGSYEKSFVEWCNKNEIDFDWQICFVMPDKRTYRIDAYMKTGKFINTYVEIKGWFRDADSKQKWEWFHKTYPNSMLLMKNELKKMRIL